MKATIDSPVSRVLTIIVSYNFERWIERCLGSLERSHYPTDVVVIDNASTDRTVEILTEKYQWIRLVKSQKNLGFGRANNLGMKIALDENYDYVFLLNQDAWVNPDAIEIWVELSRRHPDYGVISPIHLNGMGERLDRSFAQYIGGKKPNPSEEQDLVELPFINAAFWFIPVSVLRRVGGFSALYFHYGEDVDYLHRVHYYGYRVGYAPRTTGYHDREEKPISRTMQMRLDRIYYLTVVTNVNRGCWARLWNGILAPWKPALQALSQGRWSEARFYAATSARLLWKYPYIEAVRKRGQQGLPVFLESVYSKIRPVWN
ncbi:glycosyltransferase family 2 protein [Barnesiella viscericola]|uniref:glycosyltransferase family 2 protein n=1 Tax=Barnesiella viscericola TaxID=397865 RepID=UPI0023555706|nr:glycosyltransferase family 2 protein [Barnesiella viscericola]